MPCYEILLSKFQKSGQNIKGQNICFDLQKKKKKKLSFFFNQNRFKNRSLDALRLFPQILRWKNLKNWKNWWVSLHYTRLLYHVFKPSLLRRLFNIRNKLLHHKILFQCTSWNKLLTVGPGLLPIMKDSVQCILNMQLCSPFFKISKK